MTSRSRSLEAGDNTAGVRLEYVRTRRMFRLGGWHSGGTLIQPVEVSASDLLGQLGVAPEELRAASVFLLFGGIRQPGSLRVRRVTTVFANELEARQAFRRLRTGDPLPAAWAELFALDVACRLRPLCWFGDPVDLSAARLAGDDAALADAGGLTMAGRRRWRRRAVRAQG